MFYTLACQSINNTYFDTYFVLFWVRQAAYAHKQLDEQAQTGQYQIGINLTRSIKLILLRQPRRGVY